MVISIKELFAKYATLEPRGKYIKEALILVIEHHTGHSILAKDIRIQNNTAFIQSHPLIKKDIISESKKILIEVEKKLSKKTLTSIQ